MPSYILSLSAQLDLEDILQYTFDNFGASQMLKYNDFLIEGFEKIAKQDGTYKRVNEQDIEVRSLHCQKHYIFAIEGIETSVIIIAILHERMELMKRLTSRLKNQ